MLGSTPNKGKPITGKTDHPRVHLPNQRLGKLDKLSQNAHNPEGYPRVQHKNTLHKRGCKRPKSGGQAPKDKLIYRTSPDNNAGD